METTCEAIRQIAKQAPGAEWTALQAHAAYREHRRQSDVLQLDRGRKDGASIFAVYGRSRRSCVNGLPPKTTRKLPAMRVNFPAFRFPVKPIDARRARPLSTASRPHPGG